MNQRIVSVNGRFLSRRPTGVDRFAVELLNAMDTLIAAKSPLFKETQVEVLAPPAANRPWHLKNIPLKIVGKRRGQLWEQFDFPLAGVNSTLLLSLCNTAPLLAHRQIAVIHDAATVRMPRAFSFGFRSWYRFLMPAIGHRAKHILTVSHFSKNDLSSAFGINTAKMTTVPESGEHILSIPAESSILVKHGLSRRPFILAVSSLAAHKNFQLVLRAISAMKNPPFDVAIAGGANPRVFGESDIQGDHRIKWLGYVSDGELRALYESALCFVFPSLYEGFGIPPLEAMTCGCPVLVANAASMPEVCSDAALYFDPNDADMLSSLFMKIFHDTALRSDLIAKGKSRAAEFSWERAAIAVMESCQRAMS